MSSARGHVSAKDLRGGRGWFTLPRVLIGIAVIVVVVVAAPMISNVLPKSAEGKYNADHKAIRLAVLGHHAGWPPTEVNTDISPRTVADDPTFHVYPTFAVLNKGLSSALKEEEAGSEEITTLGVYQSNPAGDIIDQAGVPDWEDVDGDGVRNAAADMLFYHDALPPPTVDHWNTTTVTSEDGTPYVIDSRDWFINFERLLAKRYLAEVPESASPDNGGTGSYSWYVDPNGQVKSVLYSNPALTGFQGVYP